jgi:SET domain-containing protein
MEKLKFEVRESQIDNRGAFATEDIPKGTQIIEYIGEKIDNEEADKREGINDEIGVTYIFCLDENSCIDGAVGGNESRFINHSCEPNCDYAVENGRIFYYANRDIKKEEELTIDYDYDADSKKEICLCKSKNCRGFINCLE